MPALTFPVDTVCWFDFESRSGENLQQSGATRYACHPDAAAIILTYAIGRAPARLATAPTPGAAMHWDHFPVEVKDHFSHAGTFAAFNAGFDRAIWNYAVPGSPWLPPERVIDPAVQAAAAGLPPGLAEACKASGSTHKVADGKKLIALFCTPDATATAQTHPAEWRQFCDYAIGDIEAMRSLFIRTRQLPLREWEEYWAAEAINDRGVGVDVEFATHANALMQVAKVRGGLELARLTSNAVTSVGQVKALTGWLHDRLPEAGVAILTKREEEEDEFGEIVRAAKYSLTRPRIEKLIPYCESISDVDAARALNIRLYGGSTTPAKYNRILQQQVDEVIYGQYVFSGAPQTGRFSSRGVQIQNLTRSFLPYEYEAIDAILDGCDYDQLAALGDDTPVARKLALLIRPTFVPRNDTYTFVVSDFSQVEARILPWLAGDDSSGALARLQIFRDIDANPALPDLYVRTASEMSTVDIAAVTKAMRQRGKVAELALGFGGGVGALAAMAANYGMYLDEAEARETVYRWRDANQWCVRFWGKHNDEASYGLWGAANRALMRPGVVQRTGRIAFVYVPKNAGTLYCALPSGRYLAYRGIRYEQVAETDDDGVIVGYSLKLRFWKGIARSTIWHGTLTENCVQAVAADLLRGTLVRLEHMGLHTRLHSHDEVLLEVPVEHANNVVHELRVIMRKGFSWSEGLPLMSEEEILPYYSKWEAPKQLAQAAE